MARVLHFDTSVDLAILNIRVAEQLRKSPIFFVIFIIFFLSRLKMIELIIKNWKEFKV